MQRDKRGIKETKQSKLNAVYCMYMVGVFKVYTVQEKKIKGLERAALTSRRVYRE